MKAELKHLHSPDLDDLEGGSPPDPEHFCLLVQMIVGPEGERGEESFDVLVCTPSWLASDFGERGYVWGRHYLFLPKYEYPALASAARAICAEAEAEDWDGVAAFLSRYGQWEFEDYRSE